MRAECSKVCVMGLVSMDLVALAKFTANFEGRVVIDDSS